ncbi:MAG: outer membrane protein multidrug efflux system, partial [Pseudomonadota bacterium]|nr:outer membrane protein multidrug efflux system [Pseudomonadota bacterium]
MKRRTLLTAMAAAFASSVTGCAVGPDFLRPEVEVPVDWRIALPQAESYANLRWWEAFGDPALNRLVETALNENLDLQVAAARVERYLGQLSTTRSQFFPQVGYGLDVSRNRSTEVGVTPMPAGTDPWYKLYQGSISASWQLDLFGRVRRQSEAAQARVFS